MVVLFSLSNFFVLFLIFACYGSFLNSLAYRIINEKYLFTPRSYCPKCYKVINFYDLIPIISWFILKAKCRNCKNPISVLYPLIEVLSGVVFTFLLMLVDSRYWISYFLLFSALIIIIRTDLETMLISSYTTLFLIPVGFILSYFNLLKISLYQSILGAICGYFFLFLIDKIFYYLKKQHGLGEGDFEILSLIGAFAGLSGAWFSLLFGSLTGSLIFLIIFLKEYFLSNFNISKFKNYKIPFGPFLALASIIYILMQNYLDRLFFL